MNMKETVTSQVNLKEIRLKTRLAICQDGMEIITIGLVVIIFPLLDILYMHFCISDYWMYIILICMIAFTGFLPIVFRKFITFKRVGYYKPKSIFWVSLGLAFSVLFILVLGRDMIRMRYGREFFDSIKPIYFGVWYASFIYWNVLFQGFKKKTGAMLALIFLLGSLSVMLFSIEIRSIASNFVYCGLGVIISSFGIIKSYRFLKKYPKPAEELNYDN